MTAQRAGIAVLSALPIVLLGCRADDRLELHAVTSPSDLTPIVAHYAHPTGALGPEFDNKALCGARKLASSGFIRLLLESLRDVFAALDGADAGASTADGVVRDEPGFLLATTQCPGTNSSAKGNNKVELYLTHDTAGVGRVAWARVDDCVLTRGNRRFRIDGARKATRPIDSLWLDLSDERDVAEFDAMTLTLRLNLQIEESALATSADVDASTDPETGATSVTDLSALTLQVRRSSAPTAPGLWTLRLSAPGTDEPAADSMCSANGNVILEFSDVRLDRDLSEESLSAVLDCSGQRLPCERCKLHDSRCP